MSLTSIAKTENVFVFVNICKSIQEADCEKMYHLSYYSLHLKEKGHECASSGDHLHLYGKIVSCRWQVVMREVSL